MDSFDLGGTFDQWLAVAGMALSLMTMIIGVVYMVGNLLMNEKIKAWARMEVVEIFFSAVIILVAAHLAHGSYVSDILDAALGVDGGPDHLEAYLPVKSQVLLGAAGARNELYVENLCEVVATPGGGPNPRDVGTWEGTPYYGVNDCHMRLAIYYLDTIFHETSDYAFSIYIDYIWTSMAAEFGFNIEFIFEMPGMFTFTPWRGFFTMPNTIKEQCFDYAIKIMTLNMFQEGFIRFIAVALYPALLVSGAILRSLAFTRKLGGLLLGLAIALYFVFPSFYAFGGLIVLDLKDEARSEWMASDANVFNSNDPPIANTMYSKGDIPMLGGSGSVSTEDIWEYHDQYRSMEQRDFLESAEHNDPDAGGGVEGIGADAGERQRVITGGFDFTPDTGRPTDREEAERLSALESARSQADSWYNSISSRNNFLDNFVTMAYEPNGIIDILSRLTFFSVFFSLFSILGTIAATRSLSMTFGGDIEIAGLTRLI